MKSIPRNLVISLSRGIGHNSLRLSLIGICESQRSLSFFPEPKREPNDHWFFLDCGNSIKLFVLGRVSWKGARESNLSFLLFVRHIASFCLVIDAMGRSA